MDIFLKTIHQKFLIFCLMVEGNRPHRQSIMPYLGKIVIWDRLGIKHFFEVLNRTLSIFQFFFRYSDVNQVRKLLQAIFQFQCLLIKGLIHQQCIVIVNCKRNFSKEFLTPTSQEFIKELCPKYAIFSNLPIEMNYYTVHSDSKI